MYNKSLYLINKLSDKKYKNLLVNFFHFGIFQFISRLVPLIVVPYLIRVIGVENYGIVSYAKAICYYFRIIVEYGFMITGVQLIAQALGDVNKESERYSTIITIQIALAIIGFLVYLVIVFSFQELKSHFLVYLYSYGLVVANIFFALWYFVGKEKVIFLNIINFISRLLFLVSVLFLIKNPEDYYLVPLLESGALFIGGLVSVTIVVKKFKIKYIFPTLNKLRYYLKEGWYLFVSNLSISLYRSLNIVILGLFADNTAVGLYSAGEKLIKTFQTILNPITQTLYPYISRITVKSKESSLKAVKYIVYSIIGVSTAIVALLNSFNKPISKLLMGQEVVAIEQILRIASFAIIFGAVNYVVGIIFMTNFGMKKQFTQSVLITGIMNVLICVFLSYYFAEIGTAISFTLAEVILLVQLIYHVIQKRKSGLIPA